MWGMLIKGLQAFLDYVESITGSYGIAIIAFTIVVKTALYPLTLKQQKALLEQRKLTLLSCRRSRRSLQEEA